MDPLTQGTLGAVLPSSVSRKRQVASAALVGFLAGMAPDLDVLIRSSDDPLLFLEYHRQFTHSLVFIPIGGLICALVLHALIGKRRQLAFVETWLICTLAYSTHALLDACTTYGTVLFWPFSDTRIAWNTISIIDPLFTLPILTAVILAAVKKRPGFARLGLLWALGYLTLGLVQRNEAIDLGRQLATERGHIPLRLEAKPSFANILLWKVVYETEDEFHVDAVRTGWSPRVFTGDAVRKLDVARDLPWLDPRSQQARDVERFRWFSNGYVALDPQHRDRVIDIRYSMLPNEIDALWSIQLDPDADPDQHVAYLVHRNSDPNQLSRIWQMLSGDSGPP
ncbi:MAG: metal-dependent hydrolase [Pseudomonadota bacterium]